MIKRLLSPLRLFASFRARNLARAARAPQRAGSGGLNLRGVNGSGGDTSVPGAAIKLLPPRDFVAQAGRPGTSGTARALRRATAHAAEAQLKSYIFIPADLEPAKVAPFFAEKKFSKLQPYIDAQTAFSTQWGVNLPTTILYDSAGREVWRMAGDNDWAGDAAAKLIAEAR